MYLSVYSPHMDRKTTKRTVMTVPYNAKPYSNRGYIREALKEKGVEVEKDDLTATVKAVRDAMNVIVPGPMKVMKWIESRWPRLLTVALQLDMGHTFRLHSHTKADEAKDSRALSCN